jgi:lysophospholipase L1-like esterase
VLYNNVYFHNVTELEQSGRLPGVRLQRFPMSVRHSLIEKGRTKAVQSNGCELRFVTASLNVRVTMSSVETSGKILVFRGDLFHSTHSLQAGVVQTINLEIPERFAEVPDEAVANKAFAPHVWRIYFERFGAVFYDVDAFGFEVRPPRKDEMPQLTFLAYGSSITQGASALSHYNGYIQQTARRLEADALNLGLSGSCFCEKELADHIAERTDWDIAFFELGVNMRGVVPVDEFARRVAYLLDGVIKQHPDKPVFMTTIYPNRATYFKQEGHSLTEYERQYNEILRNYASGKRHPHLHLLEGGDIMTDFTSLTTDLIHPSDYGHMLMGEKLSSLMRPVVERLRHNFAKRV